MDVPPPHVLLADAERSLKLVRAYYERAEDQASLFEAGAARWRLVGLLATAANVLEAIAEWEPRDLGRYERLEALDAARYPDEYSRYDARGIEAFEHSRTATADLYVMADALRRVQVLLGAPRKIDLERLERPD